MHLADIKYDFMIDLIVMMRNEISESCNLVPFHIRMHIGSGSLYALKTIRSGLASCGSTRLVSLSFFQDASESPRENQTVAL